MTSVLPDVESPLTEPASDDDGGLPSSEAGSPRGRRRGSRLANLLPPLGVLALVLGIWNAFSYLLLKESQRFLMPPPHEVVKVGFLDTENLTEILHGLWSTTQVAIVGLVISIVLGTLLAVAMSQALWVERSIYPYAVVLQTIPIIATVPLIGFWFDFNFRSRVIVVVLISLFPIITNTLFGLKSADRQLHDLFTLHGASRATRMRKLLLPAALPAIFTGYRIAAGLSVIGALVGDFFFRQGEPGIGRLLDIYRNRLESEELFTAIFFSSLLGLVVFWGFGFLANRLLRSWHESAGGDH
ncbi:MAG TPA: ABC transporter permease [Acidimicrobiales bacterium]|nr:ABC transporter permease [Acidimicrobiales bacterium]